MLPGLTGMITRSSGGAIVNPDISLVGQVIGGNAVGNAVALTLPLLQNDDVIYAFCTRSNEAPAIVIGQSGYVLLANIIGANTVEGVFGTRLAVYRKIVSGSIDGTVSFNAGALGLGNVAYAYCLRGVKGVQPEDATVVTATGTAGGGLTTLPTPAITTATAGAWVITAHGMQMNNNPLSVPVGYINQVLQTSGSTKKQVTGGAGTKVILTPGAENPGDWTYNEQGQYAACTIAVRRAGA